MQQPGSKTLVSRQKIRSAALAVSGLIAFALAYLAINYHIIVEAILYRAAAYDFASAIKSFAALSMQAVILLACLTLLRTRAAGILVAVVAVSALPNTIYSNIVGGTLDLQKTSWMLSEARQAGNAAGQFGGAFALSIGALILAAILLITSHYVLRAALKNSRLLAYFTRPATTFALALLFCVPSLFLSWTSIGPQGAERNIYSFIAQIVSRDPPPVRTSVTVLPQSDGAIENIVWLVDESVAYQTFSRTILPKLNGLRFVDFGESASMGNCSTPSNVALRSGVNVRTVTDALDLRTTPTIWGYAQKAGYRTYMIDGQAVGAPQNMLEGSERAMVDEYKSMANGIDTDKNIAAALNALMKKPGKKLIYVVLRGVHFQYFDHIPFKLRDDSQPLDRQYETALTYSKRGFFQTLTNGLNRERSAIIYTSDHGQNVQTGVMPHCSRNPVRSEFSVPLLAFLPSAETKRLTGSVGTHSHSQIFPTTLQWMGYPKSYAEDRYDRDLQSSSAKFVWFGRNVLPVNRGDRIEVTSSSDFPGR